MPMRDAAQDRAAAVALDAADPLAPLRDHFALPEGVLYLDGNSLGARPRAAAARVAHVVEAEWGHGLVGSWNRAGWSDLAGRVGDKIARLVGAGSGEVAVADSTSVNLYKVLCVALDLAGDPARRVIVTEADNFPTDRYVIASVAQARGCTVRAVARDALAAAIDANVAVVVLTHVDYRTGAIHDMAAVDRAVHAAGALVVWDLAHSAGALPVDLHGTSVDDAADFAVGCGYKYLNGGPGAPAFAWLHPRHAMRMAALGITQPLCGWWGHAAPFEFAAGYRAAAGSAQLQCGTPPILSLAALECGVDTLLAAEAHGGIAALRAKSMALTDLFLRRVEARCDSLQLRSPRAASERGSQVSFAHGEGAYPMVQALIARGVVGDFRAPDLLRFGFAPLYVRYVDAFDAATAVADVVNSETWRDPRYAVRTAVT